MPEMSGAQALVRQLRSEGVDTIFALPGVQITATVKTTGQTGVEMEALTAVSTAALTVYDMAKAVDKAMEIGGIHVTLKDGGKSGRYEAE